MSLTRAKAGMITYKSDGTGAVVRTIKDKLGETVSVKDFGAVGDGVTDDTAAIQAAFATGKNIGFPKGTYNVNGSLVVGSLQCVFAYNAVIVWTGDSSTPLFTKGTGEASYIKGGLYTGAPSAWLEATGASYDPSSISDYARFEVQDVQVSGAGIFINALNAARFKVSNSKSVTTNGFNCYGKIVEVKISDCVIFGTGAASSYGIKAEAHVSALASSYPEGFHITNCTLDQFDNTIDLRDIFLFTVSNSWISEGPDSFPIYIKKGHTTHCREITFNGNTISGGIYFDALAGGNEYHCQIVNNIFTNVSGQGVYIRGNSSGIKIANNTFEPPQAGTNYALHIEDNCYRIDFNSNKIASTFDRGLVISGASGNDINVWDNTGDLVTFNSSLSRPVYYRNNGTDAEELTVQLTGTGVANTTNFTGSITTKFAKGERGLIIFSLNVGALTADGYFIPQVPTGVEMPDGSGWDAQFISVNSAAPATHVTIPFYCSADVSSGSFALQQFNCTSATLGSHSSMTIVRL